MKMVYNSLEELMSCCSNSTLISCVSSVLGNNKHINWEFLFASVDRDVGRSEFASPVKGTDLVRRLSCEVDAHGERLHTFISGFTPATVRGI